MAIKFIAEIGSNHNRDLARTLRLIDEAKRIGCWAVKFQLFKAKNLYAPEFKSQIEKMKTWELPYEFIQHIRIRCDALGLKFICTPFDLGAVHLLKDTVDYFKIGSYENQWINLIKAVIDTQKPWMISTGMENNTAAVSNKWMKNIREAEFLGRSAKNPPHAILHCNSNYPARPKNCNLRNITKLTNYFMGKTIGWSDHTVNPGVIYKAISLGAEIIEFHFDMRLNREYGFESGTGHCWYPEEIEDVIQNVKAGEIAEQINDSGENEAKKWRTDPEDGLRPLKEFREELLNEN